MKRNSDSSQITSHDLKQLLPCCEGVDIEIEVGSGILRQDHAFDRDRSYAGAAVRQDRESRIQEV